jgi:hypothetical protein
MRRKGGPESRIETVENPAAPVSLPEVDPATITPATPMGSIMEALPGARRALFSRYHLGGCQSCGFADTETLADLCARSGELDVQEVLDHLLASHAHDESMMISPAELKAELDSSAPPLLLDSPAPSSWSRISNKSSSPGTHSAGSSSTTTPASTCWTPAPGSSATA